MQNKTFFTNLALVTAGVVFLLAVTLYGVPQTQAHAGFTVAIVLLFVLIGIGLFFAGKSAAGSSSKLAFNNLVSMSVFGKMLVAVAVLFVYQQVYEPANQWFVGIFLLVYVVYTVFEVWFMTRLAKSGL